MTPYAKRVIASLKKHIAELQSDLDEANDMISGCSGAVEAGPCGLCGKRTWLGWICPHCGGDDSGMENEE